MDGAVDFPPPEPCLTCPPIAALEQLEHGAIVREMLQISYSARDKERTVDEDEFASAMATGLESGAKAFVEMTTKSLRQTASFMEMLKTNDIFAVKREFLAEKKRARHAQKGRTDEGAQAGETH